MRAKKYIVKIILIAAVFSFFIHDTGYGFFGKKDDGPKDLNYVELIKREFKYHIGKVIPLTIAQSIEIDSDVVEIDKDPERKKKYIYLFYASDRERGNYDIYLRSLTNITTVRITEHPSKDTSPAVSPDGKYLSFISQREDPEGDLYVVKINPKQLIKDSEKSVIGVPTLDKKAKNITQFQDPRSRTIKIIKDATPCWSPDSEQIAFSSNRDGTENIWLTDPKGKSLRKITKKGGRYPRFSKDGKEIIFISYRDQKSNGEVYTVNVKTGKEKRITKNTTIELYPEFMSNNYEIIYTVIDRDTNKNGRLDLRDNSILMYKNLRTGLEYPLTLYSESSFSPKWYPLFLQFRKSYNGVIVYSNQVGENININVIPEYGIIPIQKNAETQYAAAKKYLEEYDDLERYTLCLERTYHFFGSKKDPQSIIYVAKALTDASRAYQTYGYKKTSRKLLSLLSTLSKEKQDYRSIAARYLNEIFAGKSGYDVFKRALPEMAKDPKKKLYTPFLMEELGDAYSRTGKYQESLDTYNKILGEYPKYKRTVFIENKIVNLSYRTLQETVHPLFFKALKSQLKRNVARKFLEVFNKEKNINRQLAIALRMIEKYKNEKIPKEFIGMLQYISGKAYYEKRDFKNARDYLQRSIKQVYDTHLVYYKSNLILSRIAEQERDSVLWEKHAYNSASKYQLSWRQDTIKKLVIKLVDYFEEYGERAVRAGDYKEAVRLYKQYVYLVTYLHYKYRFEDIYNEYGSRAHVLYIDAYSTWKGRSLKSYENLVKEYIGKKYGKLNTSRVGSDKAHIYGLAYIYTSIALKLDNAKTSISDVLENLKMANDQIEWALFFDDTFMDPYILKGWIYQYVDLKRQVDKEITGGDNADTINEYFPRYLWEANIPIYEKAINSNNEKKNPETEGNLHLNMANSYFLLTNYPRALADYKLANKYKKRFNTPNEEALFHFHFGYCYWQNNEIDSARDEMNKALFIYQSNISKIGRQDKQSVYLLYRYFALFDRMQKKYQSAIVWYEKILEFTGNYKIKIDKARYIQEIAFCHKELGDTNKALVYLKKAEKLLDVAEDTQRKYKLKISLLGILPIPIYDLGPDAAVIGDNKLYYELDAYNKKLLNLAIQEEIYFQRGDYLATIEILHRKLVLLKKREYKVNQEGTIRTLNNIGFCYFRMINFDDAAKYFKQAWDFASEVNDLEGIFKSIMNMTNLHVLLLESGIELAPNSIDSLSTMIAKIREYRDGYEKFRYKKGIKDLESIAKAGKRDVKREEINTLRENITREARDKYYILDISIGVLKYYKAELLVRKLNGNEKDLINGAYSVYRENRAIYDLLSDARTRFEGALEKSNQLKSQRLKIKLMLNLASCQKRLALLEDAYETYGKAEKLARKLEFSDLLWESYFGKARFLTEHGRALEGGAAIGLSKQNYIKALAIIEQHPYLFSHNLHRIKQLYDEYVHLLLKTQQWNSAFIVSEKKYKAVRSMLVNQSLPRFYNIKDQERYETIIKYTKQTETYRKKISDFLEKGEKPDSDLIKPVRIKITEANKKMQILLTALHKESPLLYSFLTVDPVKIPNYRNSVIYKFMSVNNKIYSWRIQNGKVTFGFLTSGKSSLSDYDVISGYIENDRISKTTQRYIILNETFLKRILKNRNNKLKKSYMIIPSLERLIYYQYPKNIALKNIYYNGSGLKGKLSAKDFQVTEGAIRKDEYSNFSVIINNDIKSSGIKPSDLFSSRMEPSLFIKNMDTATMDSITLLTEASLYSGIRTLYLCRQMETTDYSLLINRVNKNSFDSINVDKDFFTKNIIGIGFKGYTRDVRIAEAVKIGSGIYKNYQNELAKGNYIRSNMFLNQWNGIKTDSPGKRLTFLLESARIEFLTENYRQSLKKFSAVMQGAGKIFPEKYLKALSYSIYIQLYRGKIKEAESLIKKHTSNAAFKNSKDSVYFSALTTLVSKGINASEKVMENPGGKRRTIIPVNRLKQLYAEYLYLFGENARVRKVLSTWKNDYPLSGREVLKMRSLSGPGNVVGIHSGKGRKIMALAGKAGTLEQVKSTALMLIDEGGHYDTLSPYSVHFATSQFIAKNEYDTLFSFLKSISISDLAKQADWKDAIPLFMKFNQIYLAYGRYKESLAIMDILSGVMKNKQLSLLLKYVRYDQGVTYARLKKYNQSMKSAQEGSALTRKGTDLYYQFQLLLMENEVFLNQSDLAEKRGKDIEAKLKDRFRYVLYLLRAGIIHTELAHMQHEVAGKGSAKKKSDVSGKLAAYEKYMFTALEILDKSPNILHEYNRIDLINRGLDFLILYKMSRRKPLDGLVLAEIKKQLIMRSKFSESMRLHSLSKKVIRDFIKLKSRHDGGRFVSQLRKYPRLQFSTTVKMIPIKEFIKSLPKDSVVFYLVKNEDDILSWVINSDGLKAFATKKGYSKIRQILSQYTEKMSRLENTTEISGKLYNIFKHLEKFYKGKKTVIFITDREMEKVPFELIGKRTLLEETHSIFYLSSIISSLRKYPAGTRKVNLVSDTNREVYHELEQVALRESGIAYQHTGMINAGFGHIHRTVLFNPTDNEIYIGLAHLQNITKKAQVLYLPDVTFGEQIGHNEFTLFNSVKGVQAVIINDAVLHDINNALFVDTFYKKIMKGSTIYNAFNHAKKRIRSNNKYKHPAYWAGIRLYLNGL